MHCPSCASPVAFDQRYCLECGSRCAPPRMSRTARAATTVAGPTAELTPVADPASDAGGAPARHPQASLSSAPALVLTTLCVGVAASGIAGAWGANSPISIAEEASSAAAVQAAAVAPAGSDLLDVEPAPAADPPAADTAVAPAPFLSPSTPPAPDPVVEEPVEGADDPAADEEPVQSADSGNTKDGTLTGAGQTATRTPPIANVWVVSLDGRSFNETFGPNSAAPYLANELRAQGTLFPWFLAVGDKPADTGVALLSGERAAPENPFPAATTTLLDQLTSTGKSWKAYIEGATAGLKPDENPCSVAAATQPRNPLLRFHSLTSAPECGRNVAEPAQLAADLDQPPTFSLIMPNAAHDGSANLADADVWLRAVVAPILESKAYREGGLVLVTFDTGAGGDTAGGGGRVGALLLSPFAEPGGTINAPYDAVSFLHTMQRFFSLEQLGKTRLRPFGPKAFPRWSPPA